MRRYLCILAVITISRYTSCRRLGGAASEDHHHHHDDHQHDHHHDHQHDHQHENHNHIHQDTDIQALESSIESVYASFDGLDVDNSIDVKADYDYDYDYDLSSASGTDSVYNLIDDNNIEELDRSRAVPTTLEDGTVKRCVAKVAFREELKKDPELSCVHKTVEKCHYTYTTQFIPSREEVCDETYEKHCTISYKQVAQNDTLVHCYNPLVRSCSSPAVGTEECREYQETSCTSRYVEKSPGKFVQDTACQRVPVTRCADQSCRMVPGPQECHDKIVSSLVSQPEEHCELVPHQSCRHKTTLIPRLRPEPECTQVPQEICDIKYVNIRTEKVPYKTLWCLSDEDAEIVTEFDIKSGEVTTESPVIQQEPQTEAPGYYYPEPEIPFTTPPKLTPALPFYQAPPTREPSPPPPPPTTTQAPPPPTTQPPPPPTTQAPPPPPTTQPPPPPPPTTQPPPPPQPITQPPPPQTVQFSAANLEAAVIAAIRRSVEISLAKALAIREATVTSQNSLRQTLIAAVAQAVRRAVIQSIQSQQQSNQLQSSSDLELAIKSAIRIAVERSVEKALKSSANRVSMTDQMESEMELIERQIQFAVIQAVRNSVQKALQSRLTPTRQQEDIRKSVVTAIRQTVGSALQSQVSQRGGLEARRGLEVAIRSAVREAVRRNLERQPSSEEELRRGVVKDVLSDVRAAVVDQIQGKPADPRAAERAQSLLRQLKVEIRQAVQAQLEGARQV